MTYDVDALRREEFPWAHRGEAIYLNNASTGPLPARTRVAIEAIDSARAEPYRLTESMQFGTLDRARELCARLIGTRPSCIALMANTSYGMNLAARGLPLRSGDVVVISDREFPANVYPWTMLRRSGVEVRRIPCVDRLPDEGALLRAIEDPRVRVLSVSWVSFETGYRVDLERLGAACRARGIWFVVDAIQGLGPLTIDIESLPIDIFANGGQKWLLSPWGSGFVYVRHELIEQMEPSSVGWLAFTPSMDLGSLIEYGTDLLPDARRFEVITLPYQDIAGFVASLDLILHLGPSAIEAHVAALAQRIVDWAADRGNVRLITPSDPAKRAGIVSLLFEDGPARFARLREAGVVCSLREGAIRISPHLYNTADEIDRMLDVLSFRA